MRDRSASITALYLLASFVTASVSLAEISSKCPGEDGYTYINFRNRPNPTKGGFVSNLAYVDDTSKVFIAPTAAVCGDSRVTGEAKIFGSAVVKGSKVSDQAEVSGSARIESGAEVTDSARVFGSALISGSVRIGGKAQIGDDATIYNSSSNYFAEVSGDARVTGQASIGGNAIVRGRARVMDRAQVGGDSLLDEAVVVRGFAKVLTGSFKSGVITADEPPEQIKAREVAAKAALKAERDALASAAIDREVKETLIPHLNSWADWITNGNGELRLSYSSPQRCLLLATFNNDVGSIEFDFRKVVVFEDTMGDTGVKLVESEGITFRMKRRSYKPTREDETLFFYNSGGATALKADLKRFSEICK